MKKSYNANIVTIDEYIRRFPAAVQAILKDMRAIIKSELPPEATEKISYRMPTFYLNGNLVYFAAFKNHIGFFPTASGVAAFKNKLQNFKTSKGTIQFPMDKPLPAALIKKIVRFRVSENRDKP